MASHPTIGKGSGNQLQLHEPKVCTFTKGDYLGGAVPEKCGFQLSHATYTPQEKAAGEKELRPSSSLGPML